MSYRAWIFAPILILTSSVIAKGDGPSDDEFFEKSVRPILAEHCAKCHGEVKPKGGLRLTSLAALLTGGDTGPAAVASKPDESLIVQAIRYIDDPRMPPKGKLSDAEIAILTKWVEKGLPWPSTKAETSPAATVKKPTDDGKSTWAFQTPKKNSVPQVNDASWPKSDLDRFVLAKLEAARLRPASPADKRQLIRRASFDLIGLPPTIEEVDAFLNDKSPEAFAKVIDRLLASPAYGERWARRWLDVVRYADSLDSRGSGQPGEIVDAWRYRDWVIDALNSDMPYDKFVRYQVAGDLLPPESASEGSEGFNRNGTIATTMLAIGNWGNGDADKDKILTDIADDQVDVVSKAFLGLTVSCARCHDHKFDPISQADYYGLAGIFFSTHILPVLTPKGAGETIIRVPLISAAEQARRADRERRIAELDKMANEQRNRTYVDFAKSMKPQAAQYLLAAYDYQTRPVDQQMVSVEDFARGRKLMPFALRQWAQALGGEESRVLGKKNENVGGIGNVLSWTDSSESSSATGNLTTLAQQVLTFRLPPRSISVHPGPKSAAVVSWKSPIEGKVRITGRVADGDPAGGDGITWVIEHRSNLGVIELSSGEIPNGGGMSFAQGKDADALTWVVVKPGDRISLGVLPKGEYTCDTTTVDLVISQWDGSATWDLTRDCLDDFHAGNPHSDRHGHADVWRFGDAPNPRNPGGPEAKALAQWREALSGKANRAGLEKAAESLAQSFSLDGETSPFWIKNPADESALAADSREVLETTRAELARLKSQPMSPIDFANAAQEGGVPGSPHAGVHDVKIHHRGRHDRLGEIVPRHFPTVLAGASQPPITSGSGRLDLAKWLTRPENPLTARVMVNRIWQGHFGEGLVRTPSNFGKLGDRPVHPELLDWLAIRFVESGWSMKAMHREIMLSSTYQQSSSASAESLQHDADNRLFSRQSRTRLEAEVLRDNLLSVAGRLDRTMGGPAIREPNTTRRGLYVITVRSDRSTVAALFDQADSTAPVDRRIESTVAPQSLYLLNHPFVFEQAGALATRLLGMPGDDRSRIARAYEILFGRPATEDEITVGLDATSRTDEPKETAWKAYCQVLLCSNEFLYID